MPGTDFQSEALAELLHARGLIARRELSVERISGGQSNPTYRLTSGERRYVLRKKPVGQLLASAHAVDREYRVMQALQGSDVPVPKVHLYSDDTSIIGTPFYVMDFLEGRSWLDPSLPGVSSKERATIYGEMNRVIATLHQVDYASVGLADYGKTGNYFARQIARWTRQANESRIDDIAALDALAAWLPEHIPPGDQTTIVHGDYRLDNLLFHPHEPRAIGLIDWELSTLGHPLADFSYHCLAWHIPHALWRGIEGLDLKALGIPDEASYMRRYRDVTGTDASEHWDFYLAYNLFRLAAIMQGVAKRAFEGNAVASDAMETGRLAKPMAELGWRYAQRYNAARC
jgi:aminoglycoside phosphotransferase (APT) family kinase protein